MRRRKEAGKRESGWKKDDKRSLAARLHCCEEIKRETKANSWARDTLNFVIQSFSNGVVNVQYRLPISLVQKDRKSKSMFVILEIRLEQMSSWFVRDKQICPYYT